MTLAARFQVWISIIPSLHESATCCSQSASKIRGCIFIRLHRVNPRVSPPLCWYRVKRGFCRPPEVRAETEPGGFWTWVGRLRMIWKVDSGRARKVTAHRFTLALAESCRAGFVRSAAGLAR